MNISSERVIGIDLDDTVFRREVPTRLIGHLKNLVLRPSLPKKALDDIPQLDHTPVDIPFKNPLEAMSAYFHSRRTTIWSMAKMLREAFANGTPVYGISGRRATRPWAEMTQAQLIRENIPLTAVYLTPKGFSGLESKADSIRRLGVTDFYEDDKRTTLFLAGLFLNVQFHYIDHGLAHFSEKDLDENNNIKVIPTLEYPYNHF